MFRFIRSLRVRLVLMFVVIFGIIQVASSIVGLLAAERHLREYFDRELVQRTQGMAAELIQSRRRLFPQPLPRVIDQQTSSIFFRGFYVQLRDGEGKVIERSANLGQFQLPLTPPPDGASRQWLQTLHGEEVEALAGRHRRLRMVTRRIEEPNMSPLILQVATDPHTLDAAVQLLRTLFFVGIPAGLAAASVAGWWVAGRMLRRIRAVSDFARQATPERLGEQLPVPIRDDEIGQMIDNVNRMLARLKAGFDAQEHFLHDASHELKTPLSAMLIEAQALRRGTAALDAYRKFVVSIEQEAGHLGRVVESLLLLTRTGRREAAIRREVASVNDAVERAAQECSPLALLSDVRLSLHLAMPTENELMFCGDRELLSVMVSNLIRNAIRFSPPGKPVQVEVSQRDGAATIVVRDQGPGVPPELMDRIFERRVARRDPGPRRGMGLGLAIARTVAQLHGGDVGVANLDAGGCAFTATIPLYEPPAGREPTGRD